MKRAAIVAVVAAAALAGSAHARAATWCGNDEVAANRVPDLELTSGRQVRVVYVVPSDGADRFLSLASAIATDIESIENWWLGQDSSRAPRWDRYAFPGCGSRFGSLDIGFLRLPHDSAFYTLERTPALRLNDDMAGIDATNNQKTIVYYDGPVQDRNVCGETDYELTNRGGPYGFAYVYLNSDCDSTVGISGSTAHVAAHELLHNLGAVPDGAPNLCEGGHVCDSTSDILYPRVENGHQLSSDFLDFNHNDYYAHGGPWFDIQDSDWLTHFPQFPLRVTVSGGGDVVINPGSLTFDCGQSCESVLDNGSMVFLSPIHKVGWEFAGWSGDCAGNTACTLTMDAAKTATATFVPAPNDITIRIKGKGRVTSVPARISCPGRCFGAFKAGSAVRLSARPAAGWRFAGWSGTCTGRSVCSLRADRDRVIRVLFVRA